MAEKVKNKPKNILLVGCGPYARSAYIPLLDFYREQEDVFLGGIVDFKEKEDEIRKYLDSKGLDKTQTFFISGNFHDEDFKLDNQTRRGLDDLVDRNNIDGVIISTEPTAHKEYALWALEKGLSVLVDKPITTRRNASLDQIQARGILDDYSELSDAYKDAVKRNPNLVFLVSTQRRFSREMQYAKHRIDDVFKRTGQGLTSINIVKGDGRWRLPQEFLEVGYHGYNKGYGVLSHTGYHILDLVAWLLSNSQAGGNKIDRVRIFADVTRPHDILSQLPYTSLKKLFGDAFDPTINQEDLVSRIKNMGEVDANLHFTFFSGDRKVTSTDVSLLHTSLSRRIDPGQIKDEEWYTGDDWIKQEAGLIEQGPLQRIEYHMGTPRIGTLIAMPEHAKGILTININPLVSPTPSHCETRIFATPYPFLRSPDVTQPGFKEDFARSGILGEFMGALDKEIPRSDLGENPVIELPFSYE